MQAMMGVIRSDSCISKYLYLFILYNIHFLLFFSIKILMTNNLTIGSSDLIT